MLHLTYRENVTIGTIAIAKGWWADANYDSNTYDRIRMSNSVLAKSAITMSRIIVSDESGYFHLAASKPFLISKPILWAASSFSGRLLRLEQLPVVSQLLASQQPARIHGRNPENLLHCGSAEWRTVHARHYAVHNRRA